MFLLPDNFYFSEKESRSSFQTTPGTLSIARLIDGKKDIFLSGDPATLKKPKTLILADWTADSWSNEKLANTKTILQKLLENGFSIYLWQAGSLKSITHDELCRLDDQTVREFCATPVSDQELFRITEKQKCIAPDKIHIINHYWLNYLIALNEGTYTAHDLPPYLICANDLSNKLQLIPRTKISRAEHRKLRELLQKLIHSSPSITALYPTNFSTTSYVVESSILKKTQEILKTEFGLSIDILDRFSIYHITEKNIDGFQTRRSLSFKDGRDTHNTNGNYIVRGPIDEFIFDFESGKITLRTGDSFVLDLKKFVEDFKAALLKSKKFTIYFPLTHASSNVVDELTVYLDEVTPIARAQWKSVHIVHLGGDESHINTVRLLQKKATLEEVNIRAVTLQPQNLPFDVEDKQSLAALKRFYLNLPPTKPLAKVYLDINTLHRFLTNAPKLEELNLQEVVLTSGLHVPATFPPRLALKKINISYISIMQIAIDFYRNLIRFSPELEEIRLGECNFLDLFFDEKEERIPLPKLKILSLKLDQLYGEQKNKLIRLLKYLTSPPNSLKELTLDWPPKNLTADIWENINLSSCEKIKLCESHSEHWFDGNDFTQLLSQLAPGNQLEEFSISSGIFSFYNQNKQKIEKLNLTFSTLKTLDLKNCTFSYVILLLKKFPKENQLQTLSIGRNILLPHDLPDSLYKLPLFSSLKKLTLNYFDFSENTEPLHILLNKTPCLEELTFETPANITEIAFENFIKKAQVCFEKLKILNIRGVTEREKISPAILQKVKEKFPHLEVTLSFVIPNEITNTAPSTSAAASLMLPPPPNDPDPHRAEEFLHYRPPSTALHESHFKFKNERQNQNQKTICNKLLHYLHLKNKWAEANIQQISKGICLVLSYYFYEKTEEEWKYFLEKIIKWDGNKSTIDYELEIIFENLHDVIKHIYSQKSKSIYINHHALKKGRYVLCNAWHAIAIRYNQTEQAWLVYDPNFVAGAKKITSENLTAVLENSLGKIVFIVKTDVTLSCEHALFNADEFLKEGGLFTLLSSTSADIETLIKKLKKPLSHEALVQGLKIRNTAGKPIWLCLNEHTHPDLASYVLDLLLEFQIKDSSALAELTQGLDELYTLRDVAFFKFNLQGLKKQGVKYHALIDSLCDLLKKIPSRREEITEVYAEKDRPPQHQLFLFAYNALLNENKKAVSYDSWTHYSQHLIQNDDQKNHLVILSNSQTLRSLQLSLQKQGRNTQHSVFYVSSPHDLMLSAAFISPKEENEKIVGKHTRGPGGPLHQFLTQDVSSPNPPVLIINCSHFKPDDFVCFNTVWDKTRLCDGTPLPSRMRVITLITSEQAKILGSDFYSRFDTNEVCPAELENQSLSFQEETKSDDTPSVSIDLFHANDWKEQLLGQWIIQKGQFYFQEGSLPSALNALSHSASPCLEIANGLWQDDAFIEFWEQAKLDGQIRYAGRTIPLPPHLKIKHKEGYDLPLVEYIEGLSTEADVLTLNPHQFNQFFMRYYIHPQTQQLECKKGWLEEYQDTVLKINITRALNEDEWARFLTSCKTHRIKLVVHVKGNSKANISTHTTTQLIQTNDVAFTIEKMKEEIKENLEIIDISDCHFSDLFFDFKRIGDPAEFKFSEETCALIRALEKKKTVILRGHFSTELQDALNTFILERQALGEKANGHLVLVSQDLQGFEQLPGIPLKIENVNKEQKIKRLGEQASMFENYINEPWCKLQARMAYLAAHPNQSPQDTDKAWEGFYTLTPRTTWIDFKDDADAAAQAETAMHARLEAIQKRLAVSPTLFLTGLTGVGKSTYVEEHLESTLDATVYKGENRLLEWAQDDKDKLKILFIDEANLSERQWTEFEGLFNTPPTILINGKIFKLSAQHKVIFAGNPANYGDERKQKSFFEDHGNALVFDPLPPALIYDRMLKPIFTNTPLQLFSLAISKEILKVYQFLCERATTHILVSPRELQMMALQIASAFDPKIHHTEQTIFALTRYYMYQLAKDLVPKIHHDQFESEFSPKKIPPLKPLPEFAEFKITASRKMLAQQLHDLIELHQFKRAATTDEKRYGGAGGLIIEGESGIGKSEIITASMLAHGFHEKKLNSFIHPDENYFYRLPASMGIDEKIQLLLKAFDEGAIVIIDEINSSPALERLVNELLTGKYQGKRPTHPGFLVIGTQNPSSLAGRREFSDALKRRFIHATLPAYPENEIHEILRSKQRNGISLDAASVDALVQAYDVARQESARRFAPLPTFRQVLRLAEEMLETRAREQQRTVSAPSSSTYARFFQQKNHPPITQKAAPLPQSTLQQMKQ